MFPVISLTITRMCVPRLNQRTLCSGTFQGGIPHEGKLGGPEGWVSGVCLSCWRRCSGDMGRRTKAGRTEPRWPRCQRPRAGAGAGEPGWPGKLLAGWRPAGQTAVPWAGQLCLVYKPGGKSPGSRHLRRRGGVRRVRRKVVQGLGWRKVYRLPQAAGVEGPTLPRPATQPHTVTATSGLCHGACNADTDSFVCFEIKGSTVCFQRGRLS